MRTRSHDRPSASERHAPPEAVIRGAIRGVQPKVLNPLDSLPVEQVRGATQERGLTERADQQLVPVQRERSAEVPGEFGLTTPEVVLEGPDISWISPKHVHVARSAGLVLAGTDRDALATHGDGGPEIVSRFEEARSQRLEREAGVARAEGITLVDGRRSSPAVRSGSA